MIERLTRNRQPLVCIDFGRDRLSAIQVTDGVVTSWTARPLADDALRNGSPGDVAAMGDALRQALTAAGITARRARLALPDEATVSRQLVLPPMRRRDLVRAMHYAAEKSIPFPIDRARWSWDVVEHTATRLTVYLVATWRDVVDQYAEVARTAGLEPEVLEPRSIALARALDQQHAVLLDAGARRLHVTLLVGGQPVFVDQTVSGTGAMERQEAVDRLLQRAYRRRSTATDTGGRMPPVLISGELDISELRLPMEGRAAGEVLNGRLPTAPPDLQVSRYLANLGLSMRSSR